ncbi:hypothetical protein BGZ46_003998, partial [Entomortierella lignicola]
DGGGGRPRCGCDPDCDGDLGRRKGIPGKDDTGEGGDARKEGDIGGINGIGGTMADVGGAVGDIGGAEHNDGGTVDDIDGAEYNIGGTVGDVGGAEDNIGGTVSDVGGAKDNIGRTIGEIGGTVGSRRRDGGDDRGRGEGQEVATSGTIHRLELPQAAVSIPAEVPDTTVENNVSTSSPSSSSMVGEVGDVLPSYNPAIE